MKKFLVITLFTLFAASCFSQVVKDNTKNVQVITKTVVKAKVVPSAKAITIRKNVADLKLQLKTMSDSVTLVKKDIDSMVDNMKNDLDSMSEMGETESLRLQMAMDRLSKMMSTLSNILKKISDTQQSITQNLK